MSKIISTVKDPVSMLTHLIWAVLSIPVTVILIALAAIYATTAHVVSFSIFGASLILLYTASTVYHWVPVKKLQMLLKRIDHSMIFVLIAGSYTPLSIIVLTGAWSIGMIVSIWSIAVIGIILKIFWINMPRKLSAGIYIAMGWAAIIAVRPITEALSPSGQLLLLAGGVMYTIGGIFYALKWPPLKFKLWGFHEIFHLFIMAGSAFHVALMFLVLWM
ncbi:MAG: hemolysin III family protein [Defluviitaleaceae bacterium]|nr:hemolysin III family protein [Defluviitaleaceae bacterium]